MRTGLLAPRRRLLLRRTWRLLSEVWQFQPRQLLIVAALSTLAAFAEGAGILALVPLLGRLGLGDPHAAPGRLETALVLYAILVSAAAVIIAARQVAAARLNLEFVDHLRRRLHRAVLAMDWRAFSRLRVSDLSHGLIHDVDQTQSAVQFLLSLGGLAIQAAVALSVAVALSPGLALLGLAIFAAAAPASGRLGRLVYRMGQSSGAAWQQVTAELARDLNGLRMVKAFDLAASRERSFAGALDHLRQQDLGLRRALARNSLTLRIFGAIATALAIMLAVRGLGMSPARLLALIVALARLLQVGSRLTDGWRHVVHALPAHARALSLLERCRRAAEPEPSGGSATDAGPLPDIRLEDISVRYAPDRPAALSAVSLTLPAGSLTAVTGPSGAGKSTLGDLLLGLIAPDSGTIWVGGAPLSGADRIAWRRRTSLLPQDPLLFDGTVRANLLIAKPDAGEAELRAALAAAGADFVDRLPRGLDCPIGDRGIALSGGERQRVALARALLRRPALLVLDEPTSALDAEAEARIMDTLAALRGRMTILLITHRPAAAARADRIIRLDHGRLDDIAATQPGDTRGDA